MTGSVHFSDFKVDMRTEELRKHGLKLRLPRQSFQVLVMLLQHPGELVTREQLREKLWPADTFVDFDHGLNAAMNRLREALGDSKEKPQFIETLPRRGYRFVGSLITPAENSPLGAQKLQRVTLSSAGSAALVPASAKDTQPNSVPNIGSQSETANTKRLDGFWRHALLATVVLLMVTGGVLWRLRPQAHRYAIAVLPFKNLSAEPNSDYFSDGLTDEIMRDLSVVDGLQVKSRTSSFVFKDKPLDVHDIGKQLGADLLLEGSVLRAGNRLRINVDLVRVADDSTLWSQRFDRDLKDVFLVQEEISRSIVNQLRLKHVGGQRRYDTDLEAYDLYLRAQSISNATASAKLADAIPLYRQVIDRAPDFAPAYAGLAAVYSRMRHPSRETGLAPDSEQEMRAAAAKAIELDPLLPEAHDVLGLVYASDLAWDEAERSFQRALELNPNLARVREDYGGFVLQPQGKLPAALRQFREAVNIDPLSVEPRYWLALGLLDAGSYDEALESCRSALAMTPAASDLLWLYARALWFTGRHDDAIAMFEHQGRASRGFLGFAYAQMGRRHDAEQIAVEQDPAAIRHQALIYAGLGDKDHVLETFEKMAAAHDHIVDIYPLFPEFALMRDDPRLIEFRHKRNLPWPPQKK